MKNVLLISENSSICCFCSKLNEVDVNIMNVRGISCITGKSEKTYSVILVDFEIVKIEGIGFIEKIQLKFTGAKIIPLVSEGSESSAINLLHCHNDEMITVPCCAEYLVSHIAHSNCLEQKNLLCPIDNSVLSTFIGISDSMKFLREKIISVAQNDVPVLILGATGVGKSYIAKFIHDLSNRKKMKFVSENIAAIQESLLEGELFGTKNGAFTGAINKKGLIEYANRGTLFLDEISCVQGNIQAKLLDVLESGEYRAVGDIEKHKSDVRLITATNTPIEELKNNETFRNDLYYRISGIQLYVPPLKERREDICVLAMHFLENFVKLSGIAKRFSADALNKLQNHLWPGNVRELKRCVECAFYMSAAQLITARDIVFVS